jgi:hypothetical protein
LARLLKLGEIVEVAVYSVVQEAARVSKLLLRHGIVFTGGRSGPADTMCGCGRNASTSGSFRRPPGRRAALQRRTGHGTRPHFLHIDYRGDNLGGAGHLEHHANHLDDAAGATFSIGTSY